MAHGIYNAVSGAVAQTRLLDVVANNMANISSVGFKADRAAFSEVLSQATKRGVPSAGSFVDTAEVRMDLRPGVLKPTGGKLDVALEGQGYLCLWDGKQEIYSRGGTLQIRPDGVLTENDGTPLLGINNRILRPGPDAGEVNISEDGTVRAGDDVVGVLKLVEFRRPEALERLGFTRLKAPVAAGGGRASSTRVRQGHLERANVNPVIGMTSMILASRTYEALHRVISTFSEIDSKTANTLGQER